MISKPPIAIKICGITQIPQAKAIAELGVDAIGVIGIRSSPRYVRKEKRQELFNYLQEFFPEIKRVLVIANSHDKEIENEINFQGNPTTIQLHGSESRETCLSLKMKYPNIEWWKAFRIKSIQDIREAISYESCVDNLLLDAWSKDNIGGTGKRIPIDLLAKIETTSPWWLAGGISAECVSEILEISHPQGIDASSKLEASPGIKDLTLVSLLVRKIKYYNEQLIINQGI